jgi:hypothetical protein
MRAFMAALREGGTLKAAAEAAGISVSGIRDRIDRDPRFRRAVSMNRAKPIKEVENTLFRAATSCDKNGRYDIRAIEYFLTNASPEDWRRNRDDSPVDEVDQKIRDRAGALTEDAKEKLRGDARNAILDSPVPTKDDTVH